MFRPKIGYVYFVNDSYNNLMCKFVITKVFKFRHIHVLHEDGSANDIDWVSAKKLLEKEKPKVYDNWVKAVKEEFREDRR